MTDKEKFERIINLKTATKEDVLVMQGLMVKYIDPKATICTKCPSQIRFAHNRIKIWYERNKEQFNQHSCSVCGIALDDKRRKKCSDCKKK